MTGQHLLLIDASGFAYRAYHAGTPRYRSDGMPTQAIIGFMALLNRLIDRAEKDPYQYAAAVFDAPGKTFRHELFPAYKANRVRPDGLARQLPILREAAHVMGFEPVEVDGYEADDVIATLAVQAGSRGLRATIVSIDKDFCQLVSDDVIEIADPVKRVRVLEKDVREKFGVPPPQVPDVQALCGDAVDNIPGVPGIGPLIAAGLIRRFGSVAKLARALNDPLEAFTPSVRGSLHREKKNLPIYLELATLRFDAPWHGKWEALRPQPTDETAIRDMLRLLDAEKLYESLFERGARPPRVVDPVPDPLEWWREELRAKGQQVPPTPQCGFYQRRMNKLSDPVVARIWREPERDFINETLTGMDILKCEVNGRRAEDPYDHWGYLCMNPITQREYEKRSGTRVETVTAPVDFTKLKPPTFRKRRTAL